MKVQVLQQVRAMSDLLPGAAAVTMLHDIQRPFSLETLTSIRRSKTSHKLGTRNQPNEALTPYNITPAR